MSKNKKNILISLRLSEVLYAQAKKVSLEKESSVAAVIREGLIFFLANKSNEKQ